MAELLGLKRDLKRCERTIEKGMATFVEVGRALAEIRDGKLYRDTHKTFEAYTKDRWGWGKSRAYQLIDESAAAENVHNCGQKPNSGQARALAKAPPEQQAEVWEGVLEDAEETGEKITAAKVEQAVSKISGGDSFDVEEIEAYQPPPNPSPKNGSPAVSTKDRKAAMKALGDVIRYADKFGVHDQIDDALERIAVVFKQL